MASPSLLLTKAATDNALFRQKYSNKVSAENIHAPRNTRLTSALVISLFIIAALLFLNSIDCVHNAVIAFDTSFAITVNSVIGDNTNIDKIMGWLSTRLGDAFVISTVIFCLILHSLCGSTLTEKIRRLSFWFWTGIICLSVYALTCAFESSFARLTPLTALDQLKNVQSMYGLKMRSDPYASFPSGHGFAYLFFGCMSFKRYPRVSTTLWVIGSVMICVRFVLGLHWFSDIIFGSLPLAALVTSVALNTRLLHTYFIARHTLWRFLAMLIPLRHRHDIQKVRFSN